MIIKKRIIVPFICASCGCRFDDVVLDIISENDGNYHSNCPRCDTDCCASVYDVQKYLEHSLRKGAKI